MTYFANGLRVYLASALLVVGGLSWSVLRPHLRRAFQPGTSHSRHVVKVSASHVGALAILAVDNLQEWGDGPNYQLGFFVVFATLTVSALVDLILSTRRLVNGG